MFDVAWGHFWVSLWKPTRNSNVEYEPTLFFSLSFSLFRMRLLLKCSYRTGTAYVSTISLERKMRSSRDDMTLSCLELHVRKSSRHLFTTLCLPLIILIRTLHLLARFSRFNFFFPPATFSFLFFLSLASFTTEIILDHSWELNRAAQDRIANFYRPERTHMCVFYYL